MALSLVIVDDHPSFRRSAGAVLRADGFELVGEAATGAAGIDVVLALNPDVVLLDVQLPDIDGFAVASRLRAAGARAAVVLVSSREAADFGTRIAASGTRGFIAKGRLTAAALRGLL